MGFEQLAPGIKKRMHLSGVIIASGLLLFTHLQYQLPGKADRSSWISSSIADCNTVASFSFVVKYLLEATKMYKTVCYIINNCNKN